MAKMYFTFKWGKSIYVTNDDLKKILLKYYTKEEVDKLLKQYVTIENLAGELVEYARLDDLNILDNHLTDLIGDNTELINTQGETLHEVVEALKNAKLWNIVGMWDSTTTYKIGDVVGYTNNELYLSVVDDNTNQIPPDTPTNWVRITNVQSFNLDDYYNKTQINDLLNNYAKLDGDNTYTQGKRNIFRTIPEVYTERTLPTKNTDLTTKKYVDDNFLKVSTQANIGKQVDERLNINGLLSMRGGNDIELTDSSGGYKSLHKNGDKLQWGGQNLATEEYVNNNVGIRGKRVGIQFVGNQGLRIDDMQPGERWRYDWRVSHSSASPYINWINTTPVEFRDALYEGRLVFGGQRLRIQGQYSSFGFIDKMYCDGTGWFYMWVINLSETNKQYTFLDGETYYFTMILN